MNFGRIVVIFDGNPITTISLPHKTFPSNDMGLLKLEHGLHIAELLQDTRAPVGVFGSLIEVDANTFVKRGLAVVRGGGHHAGRSNTRDIDSLTKGGGAFSSLEDKSHGYLNECNDHLKDEEGARRAERAEDDY